MMRADRLTKEELREVARVHPLSSFAGIAKTWGLIALTNPLLWLPLAVVQGFTIFNFTVLLHEVVHHTIFHTCFSCALAIASTLACRSDSVFSRFLSRISLILALSGLNA